MERDRAEVERKRKRRQADLARDRGEAERKRKERERFFEKPRKRTEELPVEKINRFRKFPINNLPELERFRRETRPSEVERLRLTRLLKRASKGDALALKELTRMGLI